MDKIKEEFEKWYSETIETTVFSLDYEDDIKSYMFICYKSCNEEIKNLTEKNRAYKLITEELENIIKDDKEEIKKLRDALEKAKEFIVNGVEYGFIRMPDPGDTALDTLPMIIEALKDSE